MEVWSRHVACRVYVIDLVTTRLFQSNIMPAIAIGSPLQAVVYIVIALLPQGTIGDRPELYH
jgi:hypothetical protein